jgi:rhamnogalacturonyl hydrolase YesR
MNSNDDTWNMDVRHFDWGPGVFLAGVLEAYQATNDNELLVYMKDWAAKYLDQAYEKTTVNSAAPLIARNT